MFEVPNVSKRYGEKAAVDGLDFVVQRGIATGSLGHNRAGKSTTTRIIAGLNQSTAGLVRVNCRDYRAASAQRSTNCVHEPPCPSALSRDRAAAAVRRAQLETRTRQIRIRTTPRRPDPPIDLRTPSGRPLPY
jgi:ABC-type branched-subunit amino acid transport system ATPase component